MKPDRSFVEAQPPGRRPSAPPGRWPRRLGWRLALGFGLLVGLMLLALSLAVWQIRTVTALTERFATHDMQRLLRVQALSLTTEGAGNALLQLMNAPREQRVPMYGDVDERNRRIDGMVAALQGQLDEPAQEQILLQLSAARATYFDAFIATVDQIEADDPAAAMHAYVQQVKPAMAELLRLSNALVNRERERVEQEVQLAQQRFEELTFAVLLLSALAVVLAGVLALRTTRSVLVPMRQLEDVARRIAAGDYQPPALASSSEEIDRVGQALGAMTGAIAQREQEIERLAFRDPLTGLPNRTYLLKQDDATVVPARSLMLFDLARLKAINETLGFATGDLLIQEVARRAQAVLATLAAADDNVPLPPAPPLLAHVSGGIFALLCCQAGRAPLERLQQRLSQAMAQPVQCSGQGVDLSLTFGLAEAPTDQAAPVVTLLRNAEVALDAAKRAAQGCAWYNSAQEAARLSHLGLLSDLRLALAESQLQMWLQPKFCLQTGRAVGAEALVRWQHPQRGFVSPAEFVPFAEQTGAITGVTDWMLAHALRTLQDWQPRWPGLSISVNVSTRDLQDASFGQRVQSALQHYGVDPTRLRLEIVESGLMHDAQSSIALLHSLRDMGVQLSIDDFGTGYSSLAYLQQLPVSELKIDRSFVTDLADKPASQQLVKTMIEMGHGLGLLVTAEGVETVAERDTLKCLGCDVMQGYLGSRPLFGAALQTWLDTLETTAALA
ncbi:MAG: hypothetical protein BWK72_16710 [Rhodoferax ferrireducens]|uniref:Diguanylate cyclase/phosphodiesterase n=1 Tax=Rhodoferax ferrireducens TaxID=192843 RepID=A0A1W9KQJ4_9BURK|nr:MAG: hypothetical protein BWK72_16710 [Rhodoferax ferrireducens]